MDPDTEYHTDFLYGTKTFIVNLNEVYVFASWSDDGEFDCLSIIGHDDAFTPEESKPAIEAAIARVKADEEKKREKVAKKLEDGYRPRKVNAPRVTKPESPEPPKPTTKNNLNILPIILAFAIGYALSFFIS